MLYLCFETFYFYFYSNPNILSLKKIVVNKEYKKSGLSDFYQVLNSP